MKYIRPESTFYSLLNHTADLGIIVRGDSCENLFRNAGMALLDLLVGKTPPEGKKKLGIYLKAKDLSDLMVKWLSEILYLFEGERLLATEIELHSVNGKCLDATLSVTEFKSEHYEILREIKAVTYHQIDVAEKNGVWTARIIFDL